MEFLPENPLLEFYPDTLQYVRKTYNLDQPGAMDVAIDILQSWVQKQQHFTKKDFNRDYLERIIIRAKGSVERAKERLGQTCKSRTLVPHFFVNGGVKSHHLVDVNDIFLPKLTKDHNRIYITKNRRQEFNQEFFLALYQRFVSAVEYLCRYDYSCGLIMIFDLRHVNLFECVKHMNVFDLAQTFGILMSGYGYRIKGMLFITTSTFTDLLIAMFKQVVNKKVGDRITVLRTIEELYKHVDRDILPEDYGGKEISSIELYQKWLEVLNSEDHIKYLSNMNEAKTIEELRTKKSVAEEHLGISGTFRAVNVD